MKKQMNPITLFTDTAMTLEKQRVAVQVRLTHLQNSGKEDLDTARLLELLNDVEGFVDSRLKDWVEQHPTAFWWKRISGCVSSKGDPLQPLSKIIGCIDSFGKYYPENDPMIPVYVKRKAELIDGERLVFVSGIERLTTPSKLWKYAGLAPQSKRQEGRKLDFNMTLKALLFRLMKYGFLMQGNNSKYYERYTLYKEWKRQAFEAQGVRIQSTPSGRFCSICNEDKDVPSSTHFCPQCGGELEKKHAPEGIVWQGHLDSMARRWTLKLFLSHFWIVYRQALKLPSRQPYAVEHAGHCTVIDPWQMCDLSK